MNGLVDPAGRDRVAESGAPSFEAVLGIRRGAPEARWAALPPAAWTLGGLAAMVAVGALDRFTGNEVSVILLYLAPIGLATWFVGLRTGLALSAIGTVIALAAGMGQAGGAPLTAAVLGWNGAMQLGTSIALVLVLNALRARLAGEEVLARTDGLTHIANRRAFIEAAQHELERARRNRRTLTVVYIDIDDFKDVNDQLGHTEGDALLVVAARTLRDGTRAIDAVARLGGDEFGLVLPETDEAMAASLLARVQASLAEAMVRHGWKVRFSTGAAVFETPAASVDEMMARADELMYAAKREEKGSVRVATFGLLRVAGAGRG
jgi:diguanylate cyclase (GGDEF)-like protein